jgi:mRNA-degrading endonuclease RelE of RelBE toxin-antitoxin system
MPELIPSKKFSADLEKLKSNKALIKKVAKCLAFLEANPFHPGLHIERIANDPSAWSARVDKMYRISFEPSAHLSSGGPDWTSPLRVLRILTHEDLYKNPH